MSAWLCGNKTLSLVVDVIKSEEFRENYDLDNSSQLDKDELMGKLSLMNTMSLNHRYGESDEHKLEDIKYEELDVSSCQRHKSVCCYLYQTCEDPDVYDSNLYKALDWWAENHYDDFSIDESLICHWDIDNPIPETRLI